MNGLLSSAYLIAILLSPADFETLLAGHGWGAPERSKTLNSVASALAETIGRSSEPMNPKAVAEHLQFLLSAAKVTDTQVIPFTVRHHSTEGLRTHLPLLLSRLERRLPPTHYGLATFGSGSRLTTTIVLIHRGIQFGSALPQKADVGTRLPANGPLRPGYFKPKVIIDLPGSQGIRERPAWNSRREVDVTLFFDAGPGIYGVEFVAESQYGPVVLNQQQIHVGVTPPKLPVIRLGRHRSQTAHSLAHSINAYRSAHGLSTLKWTDELSHLAHAHAKDMALHGRVAHGSPDTGTLTTRLKAEGITFGEIGENLADAANVTDAFRGFIDSPGHKRNLLLPRVTHLGVGIEGRFHAVFLVQLEEQPANPASRQQRTNIRR